MPRQVAVIDAGTGNLRSVLKALERVGAAPVLTSRPEDVRAAGKVVLPGQGSFASVAELKSNGMAEAIGEVITAGRPFLGICLGLQFLFDSSEECPGISGLGVLRGEVVRFRPTDPSLKVPHMGWNEVECARPDPLLGTLPAAPHFYFVHSYYVRPADDDSVVLWCDYGVRFAAAVRVGSAFACQFHPEKSQALGLSILENFVQGATT